MARAALQSDVVFSENPGLLAALAGYMLNKNPMAIETGFESDLCEAVLTGCSS